MTKKRIFDITVSIIGLTLLMPLMIAIAIAIAITSPGSAIFKQTRVGQHGKLFKIYKFRTMYTELTQSKSLITVEGDTRVTTIGQYLRRLKLDELPQLINVIKGEMSLVGPRPEVPDYVAYYNPQQRKILTIKPGITDLASIQFIAENQILSLQKDPENYYLHNILPRKINLNYVYIQNANLALDINIIIKTFLAILKNALNATI